MLPAESKDVIDVSPAPMLEFLTINKSFASRELIVTAVPAILVSLKNELYGIWRSNIKDVVPTPTFVVPNPTITPRSPTKEVTDTSSSVNAGGDIRTAGGFVLVYPTPGLVMATPVTVPPALIVTEPNALEVVATPTVDAILTVAVV